ncbi:MAG TPA: acyl-CoA thioesterase [Longimicrobiales bacterium]|nr:acyl-CoA thioesterase [Longimicrobiales bacterium]
MNLGTGILRLLATEPRQPRLRRIDDEIALCFRVWPLDIDYMRHMNNARYFTAMELVRLALMSRSGLVRLALRRRWRFANAAQSAAFFRGLTLWQSYVVSGRVLYADDRWLYLKQHVRRDGELCATGLFKIGIREGRDVVSPRALVAMLGYEPVIGDAPPEVVEWERVNDVLLSERKREAAHAR